MRKSRMVKNYRVRWLMEKSEYMSKHYHTCQWPEVCYKAQIVRPYKI